MSNKNKKVVAKKQPRKIAVKPGIDLDKAGKLVDKLIADGTIQKQAKQMAEELNTRLESIRKSNQTDKEKKEEMEYEESKVLENQALSAIDEYITAAAKPIELPDHVYDFLDCETSNIEHYPHATGKVLQCLAKPDVNEVLKKHISDGTLHFLTDLLTRVITFTTGLQADNLSLARLERAMIENEGIGKPKNEMLILISKYKRMTEHALEVKIIEAEPQNP